MAGSYQVGNLDLNIQTINSQTLSSLDSVISKLNTINSLLTNNNKITKNLGISNTNTTISSSNNISNNINQSKIVKNFNFASIVGKLYFIRNYTKQIGQGIANLVQSAIDYTETLNLWQVAMVGNRKEAEKFIETMNKAYGISEQTLMKYQATFKNMLSALGQISDVLSYSLSESLTQMALDYASLYNVSIERAMTVFQAVLSGQVRPIRSISGYDITENTIFQLYQQLGGEKSMRQLSQTEKRLLRIYAVFQQMQTSGAIGDLNRTLENSANQLRIMAESAKEVGQWFGILLEMWIKPMLPYINAFLMTLKEVLKALAKASGYQAFESTYEGLEEVNEALDETSGKLLSFDKFEALNSGESDSLFSIDEALLSGLSQYESILSSVTGKAQELAEKWIPLFVDENGELTDLSKTILTTLKSIGIILGVILGAKIATKIVQITMALSGLSNILTIIQNHPIILAIAGIVSIIVILYNTNEEFAESINNLFSALSKLYSIVSDYMQEILEPFKPLLQFLIDSIKSLAPLLSTTLVYAVNAVSLALIPLAYILEFVLKLIESLAVGLKDIFTLNWGSFLSNQSDIWTNWKSYDFASSVISNIGKFEKGGRVEDGLFTMSRGEIIGNFDDGTTVVANNQQIIEGIKQGVYSAVLSANSQSRSSISGNVYIDGKKAGKVLETGVYNEGVRVGHFKKV